MKLFPLRNRANRPNSNLPHIRVGIAHLTGPGKLSASNEHLEFETAGARQVRLDVDGLSEVVAYGELLVTSGAMRLVEQHGIALTWLSPNGCYVWGRFTHNNSDRVLTKLLQFQAWEDRAWQLTTARDIVSRKIESMHTALRHYQRQGKTLSNGVLSRVEDCGRKCGEAGDVEQLRGVEGYATSLWFSQYATFFAGDWTFKGRNRRPPKAPVNSLLSLGYMQLYRRTVARIEASGYEAGLGALHEFRPGRQSMACDIMEPLRIPVVDRWVLAVCGQGIVKKTDFESSDNGAVMLARGRIGNVLTRLEEHWHQGNFEQILEQEVSRWVEKIRGNVSRDTSRAASYLRGRLLRESGAVTSGELEVDEL